MPTTRPIPEGYNMYVEDVDAVVERAVGAGAKLTMPVEDQFWGDRFGSVQHPYGHAWQIATHVEDVTPEEIQRRPGGDGGRNLGQQPTRPRRIQR